MPNLYRLTARLIAQSGQVVSAYDHIFGIRTIRLERSPHRFTYVLNDRPIFVRGTSYIPALYLSQCNLSSIAADLALARNAHLNLVRLHVHVSPPEVYDQCDRAGLLIWQDFELNWIQDRSVKFEARARQLQHDMIDLLGNHPSIITWSCHNEPTMVFAQRYNMEQHPDPALYRDAFAQDPTRPIFLCSGQLEDDWQRSGDCHSYYGAIWTPSYADVYHHSMRLNTEFGFEAPAASRTLRNFPDAWARLSHLADQIEPLWAYQAALIQYHVEHFRRSRESGCGGYIHFWLTDLVPQVGCGVIDSFRNPKGGYRALIRASQPILPAMEHNGRRPIAIWVFNDTMDAYPGAHLRWCVQDDSGNYLLAAETHCDVPPNTSFQVMPLRWKLPAADCARVTVRLYRASGELIAENIYDAPFQPRRRPRGYPWKFDPYLGTKVFDRPGAPSLADQSAVQILKIIPLHLRERYAEWVLRQRLPTTLVSRAAHVIDFLVGSH